MKKILLTAAVGLLPFAVAAETVEVRMLNKGPDGARMVFEPAFVQLQPGDTLRILPEDRGHSAQSIAAMLPEGAEGFKGKTGKQVEVTLEAEGWYGIKCLPHFSMGMVMAVQVGDAQMPADFLDAGLPKKARERLEAVLPQGG